MAKIQIKDGSDNVYLAVESGGTGATSANSAVTALGAIHGNRTGQSAYKQIGYIVANADTTNKKLYFYDENNAYIGSVAYGG